MIREVIIVVSVMFIIFKNIKMSSTSSLSNFIPISKIGEGTFSSVYQVRRVTDQQIYALKKVVPF